MVRKHVVIILLLLVPAVLAHEAEEHAPYEAVRPYPLTSWQAAMAGGSILLALLAAALCCQRFMHERAKMALFLLIAATTALTTGYLVFITVHENVTSITAGPVHWHADYEVWICGQEVDIKDPEALNRLGTPLAHDHGDNRIHLEGVLKSKREASLGAFFHAIGGALDSTRIIVPTNEGLVSKTNGDPCIGPGRVRVFVDGIEIKNPAEYVIEPYETVPPGDTVKVVFTDEQSPSPYTAGFGRERKI
ncbi:hypothetical protein HY642_01980 [Candidatus Woesearchaeota archaeon]|nr:hypothetical protein [Candidatus Woesearchaeota archaeon]